MKLRLQKREIRENDEILFANRKNKETNFKKNT